MIISTDPTIFNFIIKKTQTTIFLVMANYDFEPPSFSLGLDLETEPPPLPDPLLQPAKRRSTLASLRTTEEDYDDDFDSPVRVSDPPRALKRLRRGHTARIPPVARNVESVDGRFNVNEEVEGFSSEEDWPRGILPANSVCSSSKPSLHGQGVVTTESGRQSKSSKDKEVSSASGSVNVENKGSNVIFPKLTSSPLRRYQLIDFDSDDPSIIEDPDKEVPCIILSPEDKQSNSRSNLGTRRASADNYESEDLWKDFHSEKSLRIPTPAFDEVIEEYFTNAKNESNPDIECKDTYNETKWDEATLPPAHCYFFHKDLRIQKLVRDGLPNFFPLGAGNNQEYKQQNVSAIDYMGQFGHEDTRQTDQRRTMGTSSTGSKKTVNISHADSISQASSNWVNPRSYAGLQKNAGSRRVQAVSKSAGHWFTGSDGQRVYVNKKGHELTGQIAYRHYRKESGIEFKHSKQKTAAKKKTTAYKKFVPKKK